MLVEEKFCDGREKSSDGQENLNGYDETNNDDWHGGYGSQKISEYSYIDLVAEGQRLSFFLGKLPLQIVHLWIDIINTLKSLIQCRGTITFMKIVIIMIFHLVHDHVLKSTTSVP